MTFAIHGFCATASTSTSTSCSFAPHFQQKNGGRPRVASWMDGCKRIGPGIEYVCWWYQYLARKKKRWLRWGGVTQTVGLIDLSCDAEFLSSSVHRIFNVKWRAWFSATEDWQYCKLRGCTGREFKRKIMGVYVTSSPFPKVVNRAGEIPLLLSTIIHHQTLQEEEGCVWCFWRTGKVSTRALLWLFQRC